MKKLVCLLLVLAIGFTLAGCGQPVGTPSTAPTDAPTVAQTDEVKPEPKPVVMVGSEGSVNAEDFGADAVPNREYTIAIVVKSAAIASKP